MTNNSIDDALDAAFEAFNRGDLDSAEQRARDVIIMSPTHGDALYLLGLVAYRRQAYEPAADLLHQAITMYPNIENYQLAFADVLRCQGHFDEALSYYQKVSLTPQIQTEMGLIYLLKQDREAARKCFESALKSQSNISQAYLGLSELVKTKKEKEKLLLKAFELQEAENTAYHLARFYVGQKAWEKAEAVLVNYLTYSRDWTLYGVILEALHRTEEALDALNKATELDAYDSSAWSQRGLLLEHQKNWPEAEKSYTKALALDESDLMAHTGLSTVLVAVGKVPQALEHIRKVILKNPNDPPALFKLAVLLQQTKNYEEALGLYFKLMADHAKIPGLNGHIKACLLSLLKINKSLARRFIKGWIKSFPKNKVAQQMAQYLKIIVMGIGLFLSASCYAYSDDQLILNWESQLASQGDPKSQFFIAETFHYGRGVPIDINRAIEYYKKSAAQGYPEANMALGKLYETKTGKESVKYYEAAAETGYVPAMLYLGSWYEQQKEYEKAYAWYEKGMRTIFPDTKDLTTVSPDMERLQKLINEQNK